MWLKRFFIILVLSFVLLPVTQVMAEEHTVSDISKELMCQCGCGLVLAACDCELPNGAVEMTTLISEKLAQGESGEQIIQSFVAYYGEQVLAPSPSQVAWLLPFAAILGGGGVAYLVLKKRGGKRLQSVRPAKSHKQRQQRLLLELARLDDDFEAGKTPEENYRRLRQAKKAKLLKLTKETGKKDR